MAESQPGAHNPSISTPRLLLRPLRLDDAPDLYIMNTIPEVLKYSPRTPQVDPSESAEFIKTQLASDRSWNYVVELRDPRFPKDSNQPLPNVIGICGAHNLPEVGYLWHPSVWGHGYATEALKALVQTYWETFPEGFPGLEDDEKDFLVAYTNGGNTASNMVLKKSGFKLEREELVDDPKMGKHAKFSWKLWRPGTEEKNSPPALRRLRPRTMTSSPVFSLANQSLKLNTAADLEPHISPLRDSPSITEIHLNGNTLGVPACESLAAILSTKSSLQVANLADIFTSRLLSEIPPALSALLTSLLNLPHLYTIDLSDNAFGLNTVAPLVDFLSRHTPLRHLILNNNGLGPEAGALVANALMDLAKRKEELRTEGKEVPDLETVVCGRNRLESGSMKTWAGAYRAHKGVKTVKMVQNGIRQDGIAALLREGLGACKRLEVLDLQDNTFTITGSTALAEVVGGWTNLTELGVGDCLLGARGAVLVSEALGKVEGAKLEVLRAQYNDIDVSGINALSRSVKSSLTSLKRIEINGNKFSEEDGAIEDLRILLEERREKAGGDEDEWGLDDLSDLDSDGDEEEGEVEEEEEEREERAEGVLRQADAEEDANVPQKRDEEVDQLAEQLDKTGL